MLVIVSKKRFDGGQMLTGDFAEPLKRRHHSRFVCYGRNDDAAEIVELQGVEHIHQGVSRGVRGVLFRHHFAFQHAVDLGHQRMRGILEQQHKTTEINPPFDGGNIRPLVLCMDITALGGRGCIAEGFYACLKRRQNPFGRGHGRPLSLKISYYSTLASSWQKKLKKKFDSPPRAVCNRGPRGAFLLSAMSSASRRCRS